MFSFVVVCSVQTALYDDTLLEGKKVCRLRKASEVLSSGSDIVLPAHRYCMRFYAMPQRSCLCRLLPVSFHFLQDKLVTASSRGMKQQIEYGRTSTQMEPRSLDHPNGPSWWQKNYFNSLSLDDNSDGLDCPTESPKLIGGFVEYRMPICTWAAFSETIPCRPADCPHQVMTFADHLWSLLAFPFEVV
ncbi:hypothetical protein AVEN_199172-1 [Araneus ventricosus]|uniref:Uncharacterized protein n=1 Tax=Araneus ventricosus TaxID=182803 RepID=A0A4Y2PJZ6_ARAVE|nr:hypothetical protein AVEN_199172-1 [Araneus ventricosus]